MTYTKEQWQEYQRLLEYAEAHRTHALNASVSLLRGGSHKKQMREQKRVHRHMKRAEQIDAQVAALATQMALPPPCSYVSPGGDTSSTPSVSLVSNSKSGSS